MHISPSLIRSCFSVFALVPADDEADDEAKNHKREYEHNLLCEEVMQARRPNSIHWAIFSETLNLASWQCTSAICKSDLVIFDIENSHELCIESATEDDLVSALFEKGDLSLAVGRTAFFEIGVDSHVTERYDEVNLIDNDCQIVIKVESFAIICLRSAQSPMFTLFTIHRIILHLKNF